MAWSLFYSAKTSTKWAFTPLLDQDWIRIRSTTPPTDGFIELAQAQTISVNELFDIRTLKARPESELLYLPKPPTFKYRRLGFRQVDPLSANWTFRIEVNTMPLAFAFASSAPLSSSSVNLTTVVSADTKTTILAANPERKGASIHNESTATLLIDFIPAAGTVSETQFGVKLPAQAYYELPYGYTGQIMGIWDAVDGNALVREFV